MAIIAQTTKMNINNVVDAVVALRGTAEHTQLNSSSACQIFSLEVYRGREQAIEISHQGFSLSDNGTIQVHLFYTISGNRMKCQFPLQINASQLVYSFEEYIGELYRMNLSCSGGGLPESGCLFFKVAGTARISEG
jgi:hypothetical protein